MGVFSKFGMGDLCRRRELQGLVVGVERRRDVLAAHFLALSGQARMLVEGVRQRLHPDARAECGDLSRPENHDYAVRLSDA